jgi:CheY-like chemotaxis protein
MPTPKPVLAVLDDEPEMRKALRRLLTGRGYAVTEYADGHDLLAALGAHEPDCLLLDLHMAGMSGFDVLDSIRSRGLHVPVVVITAHDEPGTGARVCALGACAYLKKPVDRDALLAAIESALRLPLSAVPAADTRP